MSDECSAGGSVILAEYSAANFCHVLSDFSGSYTLGCSGTRYSCDMLSARPVLC